MKRLIIIAFLLASGVQAQQITHHFLGNRSERTYDADRVSQWKNFWTPLQLGSALRLFLVDSTLTESGSLTNWTDSSGSGLTASNTNAGSQPSIIEINVRHAASFNGTSSFLIVPPFSVSNSVAMFVVARSEEWKKGTPGDGNYRKILAKGDTDSPTSGIMMVLDGTTYLDWALDDFSLLGNGYGASSYPRNVSPVSVTNGQTCIIGGVLSETQAKSFVNGTETTPRSATAASVPLSTSGMRICVNAFDLDNQYWKAEIFAILFIQADLSAEDRYKIEGWAAWRYGIQGDLPSGHPYKYAAPK